MMRVAFIPLFNGLADIQKAVSLLPQERYGSAAGTGHLISMQKPAIMDGIVKNFITYLI
jgi:hypothetical protein